MQRKILVVAFVSALFALFADANPAIEREFRRVVNSNQCLKECMRSVQESQLELSIFKRSNFTDYILNIDKVCTVIEDARRCIDSCRVESNPFALLSVNVICSEKSRNDAELLKTCLQKEGTQVNEQCSQICGGDYEQMNDQIHTRTSTMQPNDQAAVDQLAQQTNDACAVAKCSARCTADTLNKRCGPIGLMGQPAGDKLADLVERVLKFHRIDLEVFHLLDAVRNSTPPQCSYLYTPEALFNPLKDPVSQPTYQKTGEPTVVEMPRQNAPSPSMKQIPEQQQQPDARSLANQLYVRILKKQLQVLDKQLDLLNRQEQKMEQPRDEIPQEQHEELPRFMKRPPPQFLYANDMF